jgi:activating signal cointegrator complex subunit 2
MKADILRRAEAISDSDSEDSPALTGKGRTVAFEEELDDDDDGGAAGLSGGVKVLGGGEDSSGEEDEDEDPEGGGEAAGLGVKERGGEQERLETILELAYIRDPRLFDRDAQTRRGKGRVELRGVTGM